MTKINIFDDIKNEPNEKLQALKQLLPNLFDQDGNLIENELKQFVKQNYEKPDFETFQFNWAGKANAKKIAHEHYVDGTLEPDEERSKNLDTTQNLIIEGDNLQVLHLLKKSYKNKVKCIYIDPPYNTGNDFVYNDKFELNIKKYLIETGEIDEETGEQLADYITKDDGRKHSKWLSFMYPRLHLARELLRDDGVIFISIDDNEVANLKLMMNEIFGESEFVANFIWEKHKAPKNDNKYISINHDYIVMFSKDKSKYKQILLNRSLENIDSFKNQDCDYRGVWSSGPLLAPTFSKNSVFSIISPLSGKETLPPNGKCWAFSREKIQELVKDNRIWFGHDGNNVPRIKRFLSELRDGIVPVNILLHDDIGGNQIASNDLQFLFDGNKIFDFSKPVSLIKRILQISTAPNDIILDFFAGSGTTGQAVMELNQEEIDKKAEKLATTSNLPFEEEEAVGGGVCGNRKFILVQLPEKIDPKKEAFKAGYTKISDITIERVKRAGEKYKSVDNGFKVLKLSENLEKNSMFDGVIGKTNEAIFTHLALYYGYGLNYSTEKISSTKQIYILKPQFDRTKNAIIILEKNLLTQDDITHLIKNYGEQEYKFFARDICLNMELTYNLLQHFKEDSVIVF